MSCYIYTQTKITPKKGTLSYKPLFIFLNILIKKSKKIWMFHFFIVYLYQEKGTTDIKKD